MKTAIDTNVLVRYLTGDDEIQMAAASAVIESGDTLFIATIVLCEVVWVLKKAYRYRRTEIVQILQRVIESRNVEVDRPAAESGLAALRLGADFADGVVQYEAGRARCDWIVTFDQVFDQMLTPRARDR